MPSYANITMTLTSMLDAGISGLARIVSQDAQWLALWLAAAVAVIPAVAQLHAWLRPKPIPGIPYKKTSAQRLLGDIPDVRSPVER
jgi:hypothetical protein